MTNPLHDLLFAARAGSAAPFLHLPGGRTLSHADFDRLSARIAHAFVAQGLAPGDRVAMQVAKSPEALAVVGACARAGLVILPLNPAYTPAETEYFVTDSGARLFVCDPGDAEAMAQVLDGVQVMTLSADGQGTLAQAAADAPDTFVTVPRDGGDLAALLYTSGTTGRSKGAMLSQDNLISNAQTLAREWRFTERDVLIHALPIFHTHGLFVATNVVLATGGAMIFLPKFDLDAIVAALPRATAMMGVPTFYTRLLDDGRFDRTLAGHMRLFVSGSAPLLAETHRAFEARTGHRILERYGMTETNMNTSNPYDGDRRAGTVGLPLPGVELRIVEGGAPVAPGRTGTIEVRGPNVFQGYWNMPEKTADELSPDGWFATGDLGTQDADGYVTIVGRAKDLIISGGYNVYPKEVEEVLDDCPGVLESAVVGLPHADLGEVPVAILVAQPGTSPDLAAVEERLRAALARYKHPARIVVADELPRNTMGKVQKAALRRTYADLLA
ncbi:malonate--CoA ligase [Jannaschia rubra]|uniref:Long-chain-fatty-acid--CoA ligase n=1 Tax=Jannaschia rubra TaxID=282197 RepID=A0A0M6XNK5_9RHOB|nr:malonyl-CoA synthase [Jannaschia rubra]CTQ31781.1 Long-chain-fatty-acid--CoA ligase [Jannaschia rubra]SFG54096.1 malonyl-CoA/methylmalonyl-CoA synthetase [Jannaschia rubra]